MGKDRREEKKVVQESLGVKADKFGKKGDGKVAPTQGPDKSFSHQECRHILVQKQSDALRISEEIHDNKISFNEAAFKYSEDKAGAHGLLGWKNQAEVSPRRLPQSWSWPRCPDVRVHAPPFPRWRSWTQTSGRPR
jgi:parvulin-like peptidyl-prolyl isomerase